jgi:FMN phosphatase YigB (HAD superfamily)
MSESERTSEDLDVLVRGYAGVSLDLFGTLVSVDRPDDPAAALARELDRRGLSVPDDWAAAYSERHLDVKERAERPLSEHVVAALASREPIVRQEIRPTVEAAVSDAFAVDAQPRSGAKRAVEGLSNRRPLGVLSNCAVPGLATRALDSAGIDTTAFEAVVTSVGCGWRKPDRRAFEAVAGKLGVDVEKLLHIGDDARTDGGITAAGGASCIVEDGTLAAWGQRWD